MKSTTLRKIGIFGFKIMVSVALIYWIVHRINIGEVQRFLQDHARTVMFVALLAVVQWAIEYVRFLTILRTGEISHPFGRTFRAFWIGYSFRFVLPGNQGEIGKMLFITGKPAHLVAAYVYEKVGFVLALLLLFGAGLWLLYPQYFYVSLFIFLGIVLGVYFWEKMVNNNFTRVRLPNTYLTNRPLLVQIFLAAGALGVICGQYHLFLTEFGLSLTQTTAVVGLIMTIILLPISLAGLGIRESAAVFLLAPFAVSPEISSAVPFIVFVINVAVPALIGAMVFLFTRNLSPGLNIKDFSFGKYFNVKQLFENLRTTQR